MEDWGRNCIGSKRTAWELGGVMNILFELIWLGKGAVLSIMLGVSVDSFNVFIPLF